MRLNLLAIFFILFLFSGCSNEETSLENKPEQNGNYLVYFNDDRKIDETLKKHNITAQKKFELFPVVLTTLTINQYNELFKDKHVQYIEMDGTYEESTSKKNDGGLTDNFEQINLTSKIKQRLSGKKVKIAILDSGIDSSHKELNIVENFSFIDNEGTEDRTGHGTHIAGIIGGQNGIARDAFIYNLKILDKRENGKNSSLIGALEWCIKNDINIINASISTNKHSNIVEMALKKSFEKGITIVASAGNQGFFLKESITYPGAYDTVIAVGSVDKENSRSLFSSVGEDLEIMAPGENIYSTEPNNNYGYRDGTSISTAFVTGVIALIIEDSPDITNKEIRYLIGKTARKYEEDFLYGKGLINVEEIFSE